MMGAVASDEVDPLLFRQCDEGFDGVVGVAYREQLNGHRHSTSRATRGGTSSVL
jgi:hypothetical protein